MLGVLFRIYVNALMRGNPVAIIFTLIGGVAISVGPFYEGIANHDPVAITMMICVGLGFTFVLLIAIIDRKSNQKKVPSSLRARRH